MIMHTILAKCAWWLENSNKRDMLVQAALTVSIATIFLFWCMVAFIKSRRGKVLLPPGPRGLPVVGYLPFLGTNLHTEFAELAHQYGPIFKLQLGNKLCVVLSSPPLIREITRDQDVVFANRDPPIVAVAATYGGLDIAWSPYGAYWRNMRKMFVREMLSGRNLDACYDLRKSEVRKAVEYVSTKVGTVVDIGELIFLTEVKVIMSMLWGGTLDAEKQSKVGPEFRGAVEQIVGTIAKPNISDFFPILARFDIQGIEKQVKALLKKVDEIVDAVIDERIKMVPNNVEDPIRNEAEKDFIQILLELVKLENEGEKITLTQVKAIVMDIMVGGTDTTATMAEWVMTEVLHDREIMEKVQKELEDVIGINNTVEEIHLPKLRYLDAVVKETFRLHPALPLLVPKRPSQSCTVVGFTVPKDTRVFVNAWQIHRDPELWDNPLEFKPERILATPSKWDYSGNNFQYIPFGSGRRICAGIPLAEKMLMYIAASLLHSYDWKSTKSKEADLSEKFGIVMRKSTPLLAIPTKKVDKSGVPA
nr:geraniol 8-hydroxylase-like [Coffea arabica]